MASHGKASFRQRLLITALLIEVGIAGACGARTGLRLTDDDGDAGDSSADASLDRDAAFDARTEDAEELPDVFEEGLPECDPEALYVYLITSETVLYRYDPANNLFVNKGLLQCPASEGATPFSMGVNRKAQAFVVYNNGELFLTDLETGACVATDFEIGQSGFVTFGMGFAIDDDLMGESLYVAEISFVEPPLGLARIDTNTLDLDFIAPFSQTFGNAMELTSSDDGKLYGYNIDASGFGGWVIQIDKETAEIVEATFLPVGEGASALAFAQWNGDFYIFTAPQGQGTTVTRYSPAMGTTQAVAELAESVVGAGVSTCNPRR
jgi:hypothetical protein